MNMKTLYLICMNDVNNQDMLEHGTDLAFRILKGNPHGGLTYSSDTLSCAMDVISATDTGTKHIAIMRLLINVGGFIQHVRGG